MIISFDFSKQRFFQFILKLGSSDLAYTADFIPTISSLPRHAGHAAPAAAWGTGGFLGCQHTLLALYPVSDPPVSLSPSLHDYFQSILHAVFIENGSDPTQMQDLALGLVKRHEENQDKDRQVHSQITSKSNSRN